MKTVKQIAADLLNYAVMLMLKTLFIIGVVLILTYSVVRECLKSSIGIPVVLFIAIIRLFKPKPQICNTANPNLN